MRPKLPPKITAAVNQISIGTWNALIDCLQYAMSHPRGDGRTILNRQGDLLSAGRPGSGTGSGGIFGGAFTVIVAGEKLSVGRGWVNRNGLDLLEYSGGEIPLGAGYVCICSEPVDKAGNWSVPKAMLKSQPNPCAFPVARITITDDGVNLEQYPVAVAHIIYSGICPIADL